MGIVTSQFADSARRSTAVFRLQCAVALMVPLLVASCGWHLRGSIDLPKDQGIYVTSPSQQTRDVWHQELGSAGVSVVSRAKQADFVLNVSRENFQQRVLSVDAGTGKSQEFELSYSVDYRVDLPDGTPLVGPDTARILRTLLLDPTAVLGTEREAQLMRREMRTAAAQQILRRVQLATRPADAP